MDTIFAVNEAKDILKISGDDNNLEIFAIVEAVPPYLYAQTGYQPDEAGAYSPVARLAGRFILWQMYYGENGDIDKVQRVIEHLLKALSAERDII